MHSTLWHPQSLPENVQLPEPKLENCAAGILDSGGSSARWVGPRSSSRQAAHLSIVLLVGGLRPYPLPVLSGSRLSAVVPSMFQTSVGVVQREGFPGEILGTPATVLSSFSGAQGVFSRGLDPA